MRTGRCGNLCARRIGEHFPDEWHVGEEHANVEGRPAIRWVP